MLNRPTTSARIALGAIAITFLRAQAASAQGAKLLVFVQTAIKQRPLQLMLQEALPGLSITAVGRLADFGRALEEGQDAVLTLPIVMEAYGITPQVRGRHAGASDEIYALVAVDAAPSIANLKTVGAIGMLERSGTNAFVQKLVGKQVKVERVTKVEDLLPLLQLQRADAVLLPSRMFSDLTATSSLKLFAQEISTRVGLPALASVSGAGGHAVAQASKLSGRAAQLLGVDSWQ